MGKMQNLLWGVYYKTILEYMNELDIVEMEKTITDLYSRYGFEPVWAERKETDKERIHRIFKMYFNKTSDRYENFTFRDATEREQWDYLNWLEKFIYHYHQISL